MAGLTFREQIAGFPAWQMFVVSLIRFSEPLAFTSLFPYLYFMIRDFHIAPTEKEISKYSGYLGACFAFFQFLCAVQWGKISNKVGRKPVLLCGLAGTSFSLLLFGFSTNYYMALFARSLAGALNGNTSVLRTTIGEICVEKRHQAIGFSTLPLLFNFGSVIGPLIGGSRLFTRPKVDSPYESRSYGSFVERHPYALSNIVVSCFLWFSLVMGFLFLEETNETFSSRRDYGLDMGDWILLKLFNKERPYRAWHSVHLEEEERLIDDPEDPDESFDMAGDFSSDSFGLDDNDSGPESEGRKVRRYSLAANLMTQKETKALTPRVISVIVSNGLISLHGIAYNEFLPVFLASTFHRDRLKFPFRIEGGFGWDSSYIGTLFSSTGIMGMLIVLVVFPYIDRKLGTLEGFRLSLSFFPFVYALVPMAIFTLHKYNERYPEWITPVFLYTLTSLKTLASATGMPQVMLLNHRAAEKQHRAYVNSLTMSMLLLARCLGPVIFGYLMTIGNNHHILWLTWWVMSGLSLVGLVQSFFMEDYDD